VGVLLSSGVDSSLLVGLLHSELGAQVEAFTFDYSGYEGKYNEYARARRLTRQYDIPHHKVEYDGEWLRDNFKEVIRQYEEPFSYGNHTARLGPVSERGIDTLINGVTGEMFISRTSVYALKANYHLNKTLKLLNEIAKKLSTKHSAIDHFLDISSSSPEKIFYDHTPVNRVVSNNTLKNLLKNRKIYTKTKYHLFSLFRSVIDEKMIASKVKCCHI
jgi:7-cyano-7-deazaguanine synthase in queuosine biosynthesis